MEKLMKAFCLGPLFLLLGLLLFAIAGHDYGQALTKSILFFEAQRSGYLPSNQRVQWRGHSGLEDGKSSGVNLVGGYYDAGDNVKFGLPMAFTITMMSWSIIEYGKKMASSGELSNAMEAVKWGTDYLIKSHPEPNVFYGEVGDGKIDHYCWQRPEDMTTSRQAYRIDPSNPGSDLAGETAAAMAAASMVFRRSDPSYSKTLLSHAYQALEGYGAVHDPNFRLSGLYYDGNNGIWYTYDQHTQQYIPCTDQTDKIAGTGVEISKATDSSNSRKVVISARAATTTRKGSIDISFWPMSMLFSM